MSTGYIIILIVFILMLGISAYIGTKAGFTASLTGFLRIALPMFISGIMVKISQFISKVDLVSFIVAGLTTIIFFLVLKNIIVNKPDRKRKNSILDYLIGFIIGIAEGWLIAGFLALYLNFFHIIRIQELVPASLFEAIVKPADWLLFLSFLHF